MKYRNAVDEEGGNQGDEWVFKRELLKEVLGVLGGNRNFQRLVRIYEGVCE
jgi:hypothetical protein